WGGFVIDGGLHPDPVFAEPVPKPADAGPDFNNACEIVAKQLKGSYEFIGEKHKGLSDVGLPDHHGEQLFFSVEVPSFDPLTVSIDYQRGHYGHRFETMRTTCPSSTV
ncbi:MAG: hypothetical protein D3922_14330, partial [Candidatus Electrothrix sp. AR1]|nr:hypothetical protein [Candidatus Electrothrix sp. AR1]